MTPTPRSNVVSSFTIVKGAMIDETYGVFRAWDLARTKRQNLDHLRDTNFIGARSSTWLRDVAKVLNRRFDPDGRDRALVLLVQNELPLDEWKPLMLWHMTQDEFLLADFIKHWLFSAYSKGQLRVRPEELHVMLVLRADATEGSPEEAEFKKIAEVLEAYEARRWPDGKVPGGKG